MGTLMFQSKKIISEMHLVQIFYEEIKPKDNSKQNYEHDFFKRS
jgi:hypothetical protein